MAGTASGQRQGARELVDVLDGNWWLPAIGWSVTRAGSLSSLINGVGPPCLAAGDAFRIWRRALAMNDLPALPAPGGRTRLRAGALRGPVRVSLAADVPAGARAVTPGGATELPGGLIRAGGLVKAACVLRDIIGEHQDLKAITWSVVPRKGLVAVISAPGSPPEARDTFSQWQRALGLHEVREGRRGRDGSACLRGRSVRSDVPVTIRAAVRPGRRILADGGAFIAGRPHSLAPGAPPSPRM